ncbi:MAG: factor-independent urate hydroxylase [Vicinamibacteraceae bacterium]
MLRDTAYGKSRVRLVQLTRRSDRHELSDLTIAIRFEGDYDESYTAGDNSAVLPTDTMKNTVYALAATERVREAESFGLVLARHFLDRNSRLERVRIDITEHAWRRIASGDRDYGQAFVRQGPEHRTSTIEADRQSATVDAGVADLVILKSAKSAFAGFPRDEYTTLPETEDRIFATSLSATWRYRDTAVSFDTVWRAAHKTLLESFAEHQSASVQHTLHAMGQAVIDQVEDVTSIHLVMPNKHHLPVDLTRFGLENRNEIFVPTDEPYGLIEGTVTR